MLFRFKGDYTGKRTSITLFGVTFEGREPADVTDADGIRRLSNHPEFERAEAIQETREEWAAKFEARPDLIKVDMTTVALPGKRRGRPRKGS